MNLVFVNIPKTGGDIFEKNFNNRIVTIKKQKSSIISVGHSWMYPTQIKGWRDWDFPNQEAGEYRDVSTFTLNNNAKIVTIIRNPFTLLFDYFVSDWGWCQKNHDITIDNIKESFQKFVDIYLDDSVPFHVPAFKKTLFSQLKDRDGNWIINERSFVLRYERFESDMSIFSKMVGQPILNFKEVQNLSDYTNWESYYRNDQITKLEKLWKDDLDYLGYSTNTQSQKNINSGIKKPKIAICFSGQIRDIEHTKKFWLNLISKYDMDVYASFWDDENPKIGDTIDNFKRIYNVKELEIETYSNFKKSTLDVITPQINPPNILLQELIDYSKEFHTLSMWYKIWKANMLTKKLDIDYDVVIRARTDSYFEEEIEVVQNNMFNVPVGRIYTDNFPKSEGINDIFYYGTPKVIDYTSSAFLYLMRYLNEGHYMIPPEHFLHVHLNEVDINIRFFANKLMISRKSKGTSDEFYNRNAEMVEEIQPSNFINPTPNSEITWTKSIRDSLKF